METYKELFDTYFLQIDNLIKIQSKYVESYRLLIGSAGELNNIGLVKKKDIKKAIDRANQMGDIIDEALDALEKAQYCYLEYIRLQSDIITLKTEKKLILEEVDNELLFQNSKLNKLNRNKNSRKTKSEEVKEENNNYDDGFDLDFNPENYVYEDEIKKDKDDDIKKE